MYEEGDVDAGVIACSQSIGGVREVKPVAEVIRGMVQEAAEVAGKLVHW
jgi:NAD(P)H-dependent flavin oxidoreductase YrpB (nitropropane dioxygenase family)